MRMGEACMLGMAKYIMHLRIYFCIDINMELEGLKYMPSYSEIVEESWLSNFQSQLSCAAQKTNKILDNKRKAFGNRDGE